MTFARNRSDGPVSAAATIPTVSVIADELGVSRSTVSRAFSRPDLLRPETVDRVLDAAKRLGYAPNHVARALSTGRNGNIALIVPDIANPFFPPLIRAAQSGADRKNYCVLLGDTAESPAQEARLIIRFMPQVDGFVLASSRMTSAELVAQTKRRPVVLVNRDIPGIPRVLIDARGGVVEAVDHLAELGHRKIAYVGGPVTSWSDRQRRRAVEIRAVAKRMQVAMLRARPATYEGGRGTVFDLLSSDATAVIAFDDAVAHGIMAGLAEQGVRVPDEFSVIGCDDVLASTTYPPLTTIAVRCAEAGEAAVALLIKMISEGIQGKARCSLDSHLVIRSTTGAPAPRRMRSGTTRRRAMGGDGGTTE